MQKANPFLFLKKLKKGIDFMEKESYNW